MHALTWYFTAAAIAWLPLALALRRSGAETRLEQVLEGLLVAIVWPLSVPALVVGAFARTVRVSTSR
jgi:hypothetical protein